MIRCSGPGEGAFEGDAGGFGEDVGEEAVEEGGAADVGVAVGDFHECGGFAVGGKCDDDAFLWVQVFDGLDGSDQIAVSGD